jgi:pentapeptide MXKDX repeat protein
MKKLFIATTVLTLMCGSAFAQTSTGPGAQGSDNMTKPGMNNGSMEKGSMEKGSMTKGTTGMNNGMKDPNAMPNPDATSHGTVGPGSDSMKK